MATAPKRGSSGKPPAKKAGPAKSGGASVKKPARPATNTAQRKAAAKKPAPSANKATVPKNTASPAKVSPTPKARAAKNPPRPLGNKMGSGSIPYQGAVPPQGAGPVGIGGV